MNAYKLFFNREGVRFVRDVEVEHLIRTFDNLATSQGQWLSIPITWADGKSQLLVDKGTWLACQDKPALIRSLRHAAWESRE